MTGRVAGKVAFVTGAAKGQGRSHCVRLAEEGADIVAIDICGPIETLTDYPAGTVEELEETAALVQKHGRRVVHRQVDVRDLAALERVVQDGIDELGHLDIVVANAGIASYGKSWDLSPAMWRDIVDINLTGVWNTTRAVIPHLIEAGQGGSIILTGSLNSVKGSANIAHYTAAKHGVVGLMRSLTNELGEYYIRVNTVNPTCVNTDMVLNDGCRALFVPEVESPSDDLYLERLRTMNAIPVPWVEAIDISNAVLFLASDEARYVTGVALPVDAGAATR